MKANEAKSKFVYPDKLYARTKDNKTLDISYAPQTLEAVEYIRTDAFVDKAVDWIDESIWDYIKVTHPNVDTYFNVDIEKLRKDFRKEMSL